MTELSSSSSSSPAVPAPPSRFQALLSTPARSAPSSVPSAPSSGGVVASSSVSEGTVAVGKSVVVLYHSFTSAVLCCASIGEGDAKKVCLLPAGSCPVQSHASPARKLVLGSGIYFKAGSDSKVYCSPVGELSLLATHQAKILSFESESLGDWISWLNTWRVTATEDEAAQRRANLAKAKALQTPAKANPNDIVEKLDNLFFDTMEVTAPQVQTVDLAGGLEAYESVWSAAATASDMALPSGFKVGPLIESIFNRQEKATELLHSFSGLFHTDRKWMVNNMETTEARVTELEILGLKSFPDLKLEMSQGLTEFSAIKDSVRPILNGFPSVQEDVARNTTELNDIFQNLNEFQSSLTDKLKAVTRTVDRLESTVASGFEASLTTELDDMKAVVAQLRKDRITDRLRIESLESRVSSGQEEIAVGMQKVRSPADLVALLKDLGAESIDFGGFVDVFNIFIRIHSKSKGETSMEEHFKHKKDIKALNLSEAEATSFYSFTVTAPAPFQGKRSKKSDIPSLDTPEKWKNKKLLIGVGYDMEKMLDQVHQEVALIIEIAYQDHPALAALANSILLKSVEFAASFVRWTDDTYENLTAGGNLKEDVWWITTKVMRSIFEDYLSPARATPTTTTFESDLFRKCTMLWGVIKSHLAAAAMLKKGIKDHPIVVGAYAQWLVSNSGRREALEAQSMVKSLSSKVDSISSTVKDTSTALADVKSTVTSVKKTADSALNKVGSLKPKAA